MQIKCSLIRRFYEVLMITKKKKKEGQFQKLWHAFFFPMTTEFQNLSKKMSRIPAYCWPPGCSNINSILTWAFSQIILHSHCALNVCNICLIFEVGSKVVPELPKTNSHWSLFCIFLWYLVYACYIFVTFEFLLWCTIVQ
jgi:hypothetical protein